MKPRNSFAQITFETFDDDDANDDDYLCGPLTLSKIQNDLHDDNSKIAHHTRSKVANNSANNNNNNSNDSNSNNTKDISEDMDSYVIYKKFLTKLTTDNYGLCVCIYIYFIIYCL